MESELREYIRSEIDRRKRVQLPTLRAIERNEARVAKEVERTPPVDLPTGERVCALDTCGEKFIPTPLQRGHQIYHSRQCQNIAWRRRRTAERAEARAERERRKERGYIG